MRADSEAAKYEAAWSIPEYHNFSPGATYAPILAEYVSPPADVIDIGCGDGAGGRALRAMGYQPTFLDLVHVTKEEPFIQSPIWDFTSPKFDAGLCCDVMEHLPTEYVGQALACIKRATKCCLFSIGLTQDNFGRLVGEPLHLTVRPYEWWRDFLSEFGEVVEARDLLHTGIYFVRF